MPTWWYIITIVLVVAETFYLLYSSREVQLFNEEAHYFITFSPRGPFGGGGRKSAYCKLQLTLSVILFKGQEGALFLLIYITPAARSVREWETLLHLFDPLPSLFTKKRRLCSDNGSSISSKSLKLIKNNEREVLTLSPEWVACSALANPDLPFGFSESFGAPLLCLRLTWADSYCLISSSHIIPFSLHKCWCSSTLEWQLAAMPPERG